MFCCCEKFSIEPCFNDKKWFELFSELTSFKDAHYANGLNELVANLLVEDKE